MPLLDQNLSDCSDDICDILENISTALNHDVVVDDYEDDWVNFRVIGATDRSAITHIDLAKQRIFGSDLSSYQVLSSYDLLDGEGLWIQELDGQKRHEYRAGVWLY